MRIHTIIVGPIETNCYIVEDEASKKAMIIDPGEEAEKILEHLKNLQLKIEAIVITHGHFDHIGALDAVQAGTGAVVLEPDDGQRVFAGSISFTVIHTPGHSPESLCLYSEKEKVLFSGDTLFAGTWGRTDLPFSSEEDMILSLRKLLALPPDTKVYPGHGRSTTIGKEQGLLKEL